MSYPETYTRPKVEIEATCNDCGQQMAEGCVPHRIDKNSVPYCPECEGTNLTFLPSREDFPREWLDD